MKKIFTHVNLKALKGLQRLAAHSGASLYLYPVPYGECGNQFTVVYVKE